MANFEEPCIAWRKSKASNTGSCVEVAVVGGSVLVRDSADSSGPMLELPPAAWSAFLARAVRTDLDLRQVSLTARSGGWLGGSTALYPRDSQVRHRALARAICCGVRQDTRMRSGLATMIAMALAREVATFRRCVS